MSTKRPYLLTISLLSLTALSAAILSSTVFATDNTDAVDSISIGVPISCSMEGTGMTSHNANIVNGTYQADIGSTTLKAFCNDEEGFAIFAAGYTGDEIGGTNSTKLVNSASAVDNTISTGTATSGNTSNWAMKLATNTSATYALTLDNGFGSYSSVPATYTKVAHRDSGTDTGTSATGSELTSTYAAYMNQTQPAGTYSGKVKYTMVHPNTAPVPTPPPAPSAECNTPVPNLIYMQDLNSSNKATVLSSMTEDNQYYLRDKRDEKPYCVALLKDGNIWMTQNLDHDIKTDGTVIYDSTTTDIPSTWTPSTATYPTGTTTWNDSTTTPESYDPGALYWSGTPGDSTPVSTGDSHYHLGNYYNWTAAVAMNDSSSYTTDQQDANQSICPANWTLPKSGNVTTSGSFQYLVTQYGWDSSSQTMTNPNIWNSPIKASLGGFWNGSLGRVGVYGYFWSPMVYDSYVSYDLGAGSGGGVYPGYYSSRGGGSSVRCLAR